MTEFPLGRFIAHAGGRISERHYTNSVEAFEKSAPVVPLIEFDIIPALDGLIVAHGGLEDRYDLQTPFSKVSVAEFKTKKYLNTSETMALTDLFVRLKAHDTCVILDLKCYSDERYRKMLAEVAQIATVQGVQDKLAPQVYSPDNSDAAEELGFKHEILALWKNYKDVRTDDAKNCVRHCFSKPERGFRGLSVHAMHFLLEGEEIDDGLSEFFFSQSGSVFLHGQKPEEEEVLVERGFGLYSHKAADWIERCK